MMIKGKNSNHPKPGSITEVQPIRDQADIESIKQLLQNKPRDLLLFVAGCNNGLRAGDLLGLKVKDVRNLKPGESFHLREQKTGKKNIFMVNKAVYKCLKTYLQAEKPKNDDEHLFKPSRNGNKALSIQSVNLMIKGWTKAINLKGNYASHSLRKTWAYQQRVKFRVDLPLIMRRLNHSSPKETLRYIGVHDDEISQVLLNEI